MPRPALVSKEDAVAVFEKHIDELKQVPLPKWSAEVWKQMSRELNGKWKAHSVYVNFIQDRRDVRSIAFKNCGIEFVKKDEIILNDSTLNESQLPEDDESFELEDEAKGLDEFPVLITASEWSQMLGPQVTYGDGRSYPTLKEKVWCDILNLAIQRQIELECCYIFDNHKIYKTKGSKHFLRVKGHCKSKKCGNSLFCYLEKEPEAGEDFHITVRTRDTINEKHENVKRPCGGEWRKRVGEEAFHEGCANWQKRQVKAETRFAGRVPAHIPTLSVIQQAKNEYANEKYGIKPTDSKDVVANIEAMRYAPEYKTYIDEVKGNKFFVSYYTPAQLHAYKQYYRFTRKYSTVSIDGTGSLVKPIIRQDGSKSGHIFLYAITINFDGTTVSVFNFLTESQDTDTLAWGLKRWRDSGGPKPAQAVCDLSRALMNAICLSFNYQTVRAYNETCFLFATGNDEAKHRSLIHTYLRLDVAHLQAAIRRWHCMKKMPFARVRHLCQYTVSLMIDCELVDEFEKLWSLLCTVCLHECRDTILKDGSSVLDAQRELEKKIADRSYEIDTDKEQSETEETSYEENDIDVQSTETSRVRAFIDRIYNNSLKVRRQGCDPNPFFFKEFISNFMLLAYEFCLWTSVALPYVRGRASTCYVEGYFNIVKNNVLANFSGPIRADKFLKIMHDDESSSATILNSKLKVFHQNEGPCPSPPQKKFQKVISEESSQNGSIDSKTSTLEEENTATSEAVNVNNVMKDGSAWFKKLTSNVTGHFSQPQADIAQQNDMTGGCHKLLLMCNGNNVKTATVIDKEPYYVSNTCGFDSIIQVLSGAAIDDEQYSLFLKNSENETLQLILDFIRTGPNKSIYDKRVKILKESFPELIQKHFDEVSPLMSYSINIYGNLRDIWEKTFNSVPSAFLTIHCPECGTYPSQMQTLTVNHITIGSEGFGALKQCEAFNKSKSLRCIKDPCQAECDVDMSYNTQIFVELDVRPDPSNARGLQCRLSDLPTMITLDNREYRLAGIIAYSPQHYVAYCYRRMAFWENCDDLKSKIIKCAATLKVEPHAAIYIHANSRKRKISNVDFTEDEQERNTQAREKKKSKKNGIRARTKPTVTNESDENDFRDSNSQDDPDTMSRDNWRDKEKIDVIFEETETSHADHTDSLDCDIFEVFQVGEFLPGLMNNEIILYVLNTASFDALVHILWCTASHDEYYAAIAKNCTNDMFEFIASLLDDGDSQMQYQNRARILLSLCSSGICEYQEKTGKDGLKGELTVSGTSADFWQNCLLNEPSQWRKYDCNQCGEYTQSIPVLEPTERKLSANCVRLQEALEFHQQLKKVKCRRESCPGSCNVDIKTNFHCYINVKNPRRCLLRKLPRSICMGEDFRLAGVIIMADNRIKAYCPVEDKWYLYDPHHPTIKITQGLESVEVSGLFYVVKSYYSWMHKVHNIKLC